MVFKTMDINQDGKITKEELATIFSSNTNLI
jgi:Ca2+-binding EF-hand superfamily protein